MREEPTGDDRRRLTVPEAATVLGVSVDAVRGRIRRGKLGSEYDKHGTLYVWVETPEADSPGPSQTVVGPSTDQDRLGSQEQLVESLLDQVAYMREQLAAEREANRENRGLLAAALERIPAIEPPETPQSPETAAEEPARQHPTDVAGAQEDVPRRS